MISALSSPKLILCTNRKWLRKSCFLEIRSNGSRRRENLRRWRVYSSNSRPNCGGLHRSASPRKKASGKGNRRRDVVAVVIGGALLATPSADRPKGRSTPIGDSP